MQDYTVQAGDYLSSIGQRFGLNYRDIAQWNNIADPNRIYAGQVLKLQAPQAANPMQGFAPATRQSFSKIIPENFLDPMIQQMAVEQVMPEIQRQQGQSLVDYYRNLGATGGYRSGVGLNQKQGILDQYSRAGKEQTGQFFSGIKDNVMDYYNNLYEDYNKNPSAFVNPFNGNMDQFVKANPNLFNAYTQQTQGYTPTFNF